MLSVDSPFIRRGRRAAPAVRLFCLPYAGGGASTYATWPRLLPDEVEVVAIQLPGREDRQQEEHFVELRPLVRTLAHAVRPYLQLPYAIFGHCAGALLAFELAAQLRDRFDAPALHLFPSAQAAPHLPARNAPIHVLGDDDFQTALRRLDGSHSDVLANTALMQMLMTCLRGDFALWERYRYVDRAPLDCPITAFAGTEDQRVTIEEIASWSRHTTAGFSIQEIAGGHFFVTDRAAEVTRVIGAALLDEATTR